MAGGFDTIKPAGIAWAVTPSDSAALVQRTRMIYVGTGGNISLGMIDPTTNKIAAVVLPDIPSGAFIPVEVSYVYSTSTTATGIVAFA